MADFTHDYTSNYEVSPIAELSNGIILSRFEKNSVVRDQSYQTESELERKLIENLLNQGYERLEARTNEALYENLKKQIERLNKVTFSDDEWERFLLEYIDAPNDGMIEKTRKVQVDHVYEFLFDSGISKNIILLTRKTFTTIFCRLQIKSTAWATITIVMMLRFL